MTVRSMIAGRVRAQVTELREVAGAADLRGVLEGRVTAPAAYIYRLRNSAGPNQLDNAVSQTVRESYAVVVVTQNLRDARGGDSSDTNEALCDQVSDALLGWSPDVAADALEYGGGQLVSMKDGYFYWQEVYTTARLRRAV